MASVCATSPRASHCTLRRTECCSAIMPLVLQVIALEKENTPLSQNQFLERKNLYLEHLPPEKICNNCSKLAYKPPNPFRGRTRSYYDLSGVLKS